MIRLLNGEEWQESEILKRMDDDSFYYGHLGQHALSSSALKKLIESPKAYKKSLEKSETSQALRDGRLIHLAVLEKHKLNDLVITSGTKARKEYKDAVYEYGEHLVYTESEFNNAKSVAHAIESNDEVSFLLSNCDYEVAGIDMIEELPFRAKADVITKDRSVIIDLKTTSSKVENFMWAAKDFDYALQAKLYLDIFNAVEFIFVVVQKETKDIGIFPCSEEFLEYGAARIRQGISQYKSIFMQPNAEELIKNYVIRGVL